MAEENNVWPLPKFYFLVSIDGIESTFQEVSGLEAETQIIEYRHSNSPEFSTIKMPGISKVGNITLKKVSLLRIINSGIGILKSL